MTREEQAQRAFAITRKMRADTAKLNRKGPSKLTWVQMDAREELARLIGASAKRAADDAPPDRED